MKCPSCAWVGSRGDLCLDPNKKNISEILDLSNWSLCPACSTNVSVKTTDLELGLQHNNAVLYIHNKTTGAIAGVTATYVHLGRLLDFKILPYGLYLTGYKSFSKHCYQLRIFLNTNSEQYESETLLKIISLLHKSRYKCETKTHNNLQLFGKWKDADTIFPLIKCSFCARIHEFEKKTSNGWPLSIKKLNEEKLNSIRRLANVPIYNKNRKFSIIFEDIKTQKETTNNICYCNEISPLPNPDCDIHKTLD
jgi:hypothetical protein